MSRSILVSYIILTILAVSTISCATSVPEPTAQPTSTSVMISSSPTPDTPATPTTTLQPSNEWKTYTNSEYGFSINHPADFEITHIENSTSLYIGKQIFVSVRDSNPADCRGDCPVIESTKTVTVAGLDATKVMGYIGAIGGNNPQQYLSFIIFNNNLYHVFTLYALDFDAPLMNPPPDAGDPLNESHVILFEKIMETLSFTE